MSRISCRSMNIGMAGLFAELPLRDRQTLSGPRARREAAIPSRAGRAMRSLDDEGWLQGDALRDVVEIRRRRHHRPMDLGELFLAAAALDVDDVAQVLVPRRHRGIDPEEAAEVDVAFGLDLQLLDGDPAHRALCDVPHRHAGVEASRCSCGLANSLPPPS